MQIFVSTVVASKASTFKVLKYYNEEPLILMIIEIARQIFEGLVKFNNNSFNNQCKQKFKLFQ